MSIGEMQSCLARLYVDEPFRRLFAVDSGAILNAYFLSKSEQQALLGIDRALLDEFALSLIAKRRKPVERAYPLLFRLNGAVMQRCYTRFYHLYPAKCDRTYADDIADFGGYMEETLPAIDSMPEYASDLARYERHCAAVINAGPRRRHEPAALDSSNSLEAIPRLHPQTTMAEFHYDVVDLERALFASSAFAPPVLERSASTILFFSDADDGALRMSRVNAPSRAVIELCDGERTVATIVSEVERRYGIGGLSDAVAPVIERLLADGALVRSEQGYSYDVPRQHTFLAVAESFGER